MHKAFLLGAGLGTRLRPLTDSLPKPLIPFKNRPLVTHIMDHCLEAGITDFAINTHHLPEAWHEAFPDKTYRGASLTFFHEPNLLETGGGLKNIASWIGYNSILIHNADILTGLPLERLITGHMSSNNTATLAVQDHGPALRLAVDGYSITDINGKVSGQPGTHQFTGVYVVDPEILDLIPEGEKISIKPAFQELIQRGELGAYLVKGNPGWMDLGTRESYLEASFESTPEISPDTDIAPTATITNSWVAPGCRIGDRAKIIDSILWPETIILDDAELTKCIVHSKSPAAGVFLDADL